MKKQDILANESDSDNYITDVIQYQRRESRIRILL